jgi:hypothetical protein
MNPKELLEKLPLVRGWIDRTLAEHSYRAQPVASYRFPRLGGFYSSELLNTAKVVEVERVPMPPLSALGLTGFGEFETGNYAGITFLDTYFVQIGNEARRESLHFHELVHVVQWQHLGAERFVMAYALGYLQGGGYRANPLEVMAYDLQDYFEKNGPPIEVEPFVRRQLDSLMPEFDRVLKGES